MKQRNTHGFLLVFNPWEAYHWRLGNGIDPEKIDPWQRQFERASTIGKNQGS
jgi:hypothetical protein